MRPTTIEEACAHTGDDLKQIEAAAAMMPDWLKDFIKATALSAVVVKALNDGKIPDPTDGSWKHEMVFDLTASGPSGLGLAFHDTDCWYTRTHVGARLQILDDDDAEYFGEHPAFQQLHYDRLTYKAAV